jgi:hypothetical protein
MYITGTALHRCILVPWQNGDSPIPGALLISKNAVTGGRLIVIKEMK